MKQHSHLNRYIHWILNADTWLFQHSPFLSTFFSKLGWANNLGGGGFTAYNFTFYFVFLQFFSSIEVFGCICEMSLNGSLRIVYTCSAGNLKVNLLEIASPFSNLYCRVLALWNRAPMLISQALCIVVSSVISLLHSGGSTYEFERSVWI